MNKNNFLELQNFYILKLLENNTSVSIGKIGANELNSIINLDINQNFLFYNAGIFPNNKEIMKKYLNLLKIAIRDLDVIAIWGNNQYLQKNLSNQKSVKVKLRALEPYYHKNFWSKILLNKKVLVISPFTDTITKQYKKKNLIWKNTILPEFELITLKFPLSHALLDTGYESFLDLLDDYKKKINNIDFDIALIGCGGYSLLLCQHIKLLNKSAFHLGGALQILFGIKGGRWDNHEVISKFFNEHWVRPNQTETPNQKEIIENSAYW
jgi:hypothetical protein